MKSLVDGDCGQQNSLVRLAGNYGASSTRISSANIRGTSALLPSSSLGEQFANDFLKQKSAATVAPSTFSMKALSAQLPKPSSSTSLSSNWASEFAGARPANQLAAQWSQQYSANPTYTDAWKSASAPLQHQQGSSSVDSGMWSSEYLDNFDTSFQAAQSSTSSMADAWANEFAEQQPDVWRNMEQEWDSIQRNIAQAQGEAPTEYMPEYIHQSDNPFINSSDAMAQGDALMQAGDLSNAMLAYEAAVQKNPQDAEAWCRLGLSHAENEHDRKAIVAFNNCLRIQPNNQEAILALSVSLANESLENDALNALEKWIVAHEGGDPTTVTKQSSTYSSFLDHQAFAKVEERFLSAARRQSGQADAALQNAMGVLYNLNRNFDRAVECIRLAIASRPDDPRLWNRLGATLANGDRTVDAIAAYREALQRYPTYVRARYNLGISCMHLNSYREALDHFLSALELQKGGAEESSIWPTMRSAAIRVRDAPDEILAALDHRDIAAFKNALRQIPNNA